MTHEEGLVWSLARRVSTADEVRNGVGMSLLSKCLLIAVAVFSIAGIIYAAGLPTAPVAQAQTTGASFVPALGTTLLIATGSIGLFVSKLLPRRKN